MGIKKTLYSTGSFFPNCPVEHINVSPSSRRCEVLRPSSAGGNLQMVSRLFLQFLHLTNTRQGELQASCLQCFTSSTICWLSTQSSRRWVWKCFSKYYFNLFEFCSQKSCYLKLEQRIIKIINQWFHKSSMNKSCSVLLKRFLGPHCCLIITSAKPHPDPESSTPATKATAASKYFLSSQQIFLVSKQYF